MKPIRWIKYTWIKLIKCVVNAVLLTYNLSQCITEFVLGVKF